MTNRPKRRIAVLLPQDGASGPSPEVVMEVARLVMDTLDWQEAFRKDYQLAMERDQQRGYQDA